MAEAADAPSQPSPLPPDADTEVWPTVAELSAAARDGKPEHTDLDEVSKTEHSQSVKGGHSYYYWHRDAERRRQNGEVKPPPPVPKRLETSEDDLAAAAEKRGRPISSFSFMDDSDVVKIYVPLDGALAGATLAEAEVEFSERSLLVNIDRPDAIHRFTVERLAHEVEPARCKARVVKSGKLVITLYKRNAIERWPKLRA